jgi:tripartite-type tricarboxylate transporter receptor subunit TctC
MVLAGYQGLMVALPRTRRRGRIAPLDRQEFEHMTMEVAASTRRRRRRLVLPAALAACGLLLAQPAAAQDVASFYKGKTFRIVVGFSPGGGYDVYARLLGRHIGRHIPGNPTVVVQNMPGAASLKSVQYLTAGAPNDGTLITTFNPGLIVQSLTSPEKVPVKFLEHAWIGNVSEDFRVCYTWNATGIKSWNDFMARPKVTFGNTGVGTSAYIDNRIVSELMGAKLHGIQGYPGSADKRLAIERGELDGDCGSWTSLPEEWIKDNKITVLVRFSKIVLPGMPPNAAYAGDLIKDAKKRQVFNLLTAGATIGRPYIASAEVPADRLAALRKAFDDTVKDPEFLAEAAKLNLTVTPMKGTDVEAAIREVYKAPADVVAAAKEISGD